MLHTKKGKGLRDLRDSKVSANPIRISQENLLGKNGDILDGSLKDSEEPKETNVLFVESQDTMPRIFHKTKRE